jgi:hypothetical protein
MAKTRSAVPKTKAEAKTPPPVESLPVRHPHAAGIDVGEATHWVCVGA